MFLKNENIREEMLDILETLHKYVPYKKAAGNVSIYVYVYNNRQLFYI